MFKCQSCDVVCQCRQPEHRIVIHKRETSYPYREQANKVYKWGKTKLIDDQGGTGWEIDTEIRVCPECYQQLTGETPTIVEVQEPLDISDRLKTKKRPRQQNKYKEKKKKPEVVRINKI